MDTVPSTLRLLLAFELFAVSCAIRADTMLVPDQDSNTKAVVGAADATERSSSPRDTNTANRPPAQSQEAPSAGAAPAATSGSGNAAGRNAQADAGAAALGNAGSGLDKPPATSGGVGGSVEPAGGSSAMAQAQPASAADPDCDFTGVWIAKQLTVSEALGLPQTSNSWFYLEFQQTGQDVVVTKSLECGVEVRGTATVTLSRATFAATLVLNPQVGRKATLKKLDGKCVFATSRFWKIRGADERRFLPNEARDSMAGIAEVAKDKPLPTPSMTDGAVDTEGDGKLGMAFQVSGVIQGVRNSVQREWSVWFTEAGFEIEPSANWPSELTIRADFDNEESILDPTSGLLAASAQPASSAKHRLKLRFLGRDRSDPRAAAIITANDVDTCYAIQDAMTTETLE